MKRAIILAVCLIALSSCILIYKLVVLRYSLATKPSSPLWRVCFQMQFEGEGEKAKILGKMEKELAQIRSEAYRRAQEIMGEADAKATAIYAQAYEEDPDFFNFSKTLETYRKTLPQKTLIVVPLNSKFFKYLIPEAVPEKEKS